MVTMECYCVTFIVLLQATIHLSDKPNYLFMAKYSPEFNLLYYLHAVV